MSLLLVGLLLLSAPARAAAAGGGAPLIQYLNEVVAWYRAVSSMAPLATNPAEVLVFSDAPINALERSIPELHGNPASSTATPALAASASRASSSDRGVLPLFAELFSLIRKERELHDVSNSTDALRDSLDRLPTPLMAELRSTLQEGDQPTHAPQSTDAAVLQDRTRRIDEVTAHFKKVSGALVPLGKQSIVLAGREDDPVMRAKLHLVEDLPSMRRTAR